MRQEQKHQLVGISLAILLLVIIVGVVCFAFGVDMGYETGKKVTTLTIKSEIKTGEKYRKPYVIQSLGLVFHPKHKGSGNYRTVIIATN